MEHNNCKTNLVLLCEIPQLKYIALAVLKETLCLKSRLGEVISASVSDHSSYQNVYFCCIKNMHSKNWSTGPKSNQVFQRKKKIKKKRLCHKSRVTACLSAPPAPAHWVRGAVVTAAGLSAMAAGGVEERGGLEAAVRGGLRILRERWMRGTRERSGTAAFAGPPCPSLPEDVEEVSALQALPVSGARVRVGSLSSGLLTSPTFQFLGSLKQLLSTVFRSTCS